MDAGLKKLLKNIKENESTISMMLGGLVVIVIGILLVNYYRQSGRPQITQESTATVSGELAVDVDSDIDINGVWERKEARVNEEGQRVHKVSRGEHLWAIAESYYGSGYNWVDIAGENQLIDPGTIEVGQELIIPQVAPKEPTMADRGAEIEKIPDRIGGASYEVQAGDSLWTIALRSYSDGYQWIKIWEANKEQVRDPNVIEVGQQLTIPR